MPAMLNTLYLRCDAPVATLRWESVVKGLQQAADCGAKHILVNGLRRDISELVERVLEVSLRKGFSIRVDAELDEGWVACWDSMVARGLDFVVHIPSVTFPFEDLKIPRLIAPRLTAYLTVDGRNQQGFEAEVETILNVVGVGRVVLVVVMQAGLGPSEYTWVCERIRKLATQYPNRVWARLPWVLLDERSWHVSRRLCDYSHTIGLRLDGGVVPCGVDVHNEGEIPNIRDASLEEILRFDPFITHFRQMVVPDEVQGVCRRCVFRRYCANICPAYVYNKTGSFTNSYPECELMLRAGVFPASCLLETAV